MPFPGTGTAPSLLNRSYTITADIEVPEGGGEGVLVSNGGRYRGYGFYLLKGRPVFTWNLVQLAMVKWQGTDALAPGKHTLVFDWHYDGPGLGKGGTGTLSVDGKVVDSHAMPRSLPITVGWNDTFNVGLNTDDAGGPRRLPGAVPLQRQDQQADREAWTGRSIK